MIGRTVLTLLGLFALAAPLAAQRPSVRWARWEAPALGSARGSASRPHGATTVGMIAAGVGGGTVGFFAGGFIGYELGGGSLVCGDDACGLEEAAYGAIAGESVLLPLGVHVANRRQGNYGLSLLASAAIGGLGILAVNASHDGIPLIVVPVAQLVSSVLIERATSR
jgi:hypothetical protein